MTATHVIIALLVLYAVRLRFRVCDLQIKNLNLKLELDDADMGRRYWKSKAESLVHHESLRDIN